ncbi:F-box domain containing protein [Pandoravirus neocaledonia]|uniref:F-box domain containing protein n=1 Tax=Pandoravirus neocaledonia TaxID=2107708 RepID=A0A2U7UCL2_9VIRU|nr:F-box domain containing protein [Pandoravirus neocaledonia]AVK76173.1 F-box domain containing protein [Pandoravirus neocaledonia]
MGRFRVKSNRVCAAWPGSGRHMPKRPRRQRLSPNADQAGTRARSGSAVAWFADLTGEIVEAICAHLRGRDLAALACTCRILAAIARGDRVWRVAFERDLGVAYPPIEHADHVHYGKSVQWLYGLIATPAGRLRMAPNGTLAGRIVAADGVSKRSGEFHLHIGAAGDATVRLNGYGAKIEPDGAPYNTWSAREGFYEDDHVVGRMRHLAHGTSENGSAPVNYEYCFRGGSLDGQTHGFGHTRHRDGHVHFGEHSAKHYNGRCLMITAARNVYSGQLAYDAYSGYGVSLDRGMGITAEHHRTDDVPAWGIARAANPQTAAASTTASTTATTTAAPQPGHAWRVARVAYYADDAASADGRAGPASVETVYEAPATRGSYLSANGTTWERFEHRGHTLILHDGMPVFLAVSDNHPTMAGARIFYNDINGDGSESEHLSAAGDAESGAPQCHALTRDCSVASLGGPTAPGLGRMTPTAYLDAISDGDAGALLGNLHKRASNVSSGSALYAPFGVPLAGRNGAFSVRCFITGLRTKARECAFAPSGLLYSTDGFDLWERMCTSTAAPFTDPYTGDITVPDIPQLMWQRWMGFVPFALVVPAVREAFQRWAALQSSSTTEKGGSCARPSWHMHDLVRKSVADALGVPLLDVTHVLGNLDRRALEGSGIGAPVAGTLVGRSASLRPPIKGWDRTKLANVEFRHPSWDPRGPWRFGSDPAYPMPDDPTLADYERDPNAAPTAYYASHGVIKVALSRPSFVGAHLRNVFFIGQDLHAASFVGAVLDRCAFIGCALDNWRLLGASLVMCGFHDCHIAGLPVASAAHAAGNRGATVWPL